MYARMMDEASERDKTVKIQYIHRSSRSVSHDSMRPWKMGYQVNTNRTSVVSRHQSTKRRAHILILCMFIARVCFDCEQRITCCFTRWGGMRRTEMKRAEQEDERQGIEYPSIILLEYGHFLQFFVPLVQMQGELLDFLVKFE